MAELAPVPALLRCPLCAATEQRSVLRQTAWSVLACPACGLVFVHPPPAPDKLEAVYPENYYAHLSLTPDNSSLRGDLKRLVAAECFGLPLRHRFASWPRLARRALAWLLRGQMRIPPPRAGERRVLDVGCGNGAYLHWLRELGWECYGNEIDSGAVAAARAASLDVFHGDIQQAAYPADFFDVVNLSSVLDHTADPLGVVREIMRTLKPGGWVIAHSPNVAGVQSRLFGRNWYNFIPPEHLFYFTPRTYRAAFRQAGFVVERVWTHSPTNFLAHTLLYRTPARALCLPLRERFGFEPEWWLPVKALVWPLSVLEDALGRGELVYLQARKPAGAAEAAP